MTVQPRPLRSALLVMGVAICLAACGGDDDDAADPTPPTQRSAQAPATEVVVEATEPVDTEAPASTDPPATPPPTTMTTVAPTTTEPASTNVGVVWSSAVDPARVNQPPDSQPRFDADGITAQIDMFLSVDPSIDGDTLSELCAEQIAVASENGGPPEVECLYVQWLFNVSAELDDDAYLIAGPLLNTDGQQVEPVDGYGSGVPGAVGRGMQALYVGGEPGALLRFTTNYETEHEVVVSPREAMLPIDFD